MQKTVDLLFAGFLVDDESFNNAMAVDRYPQFAAHRFQKTMMNMLLELDWKSVTVLGSVPASPYPINSKIILKYRKWFNGDTAGYVVPVINLPVIRSFFRLIGYFTFLSIWSLSRRRANREKLIFLYALHTPHLLPIFVCNFLFGTKAIVFVPDLPLYMNAGRTLNFIKKYLKVVDSRLLLWLANKIEGRIVITESMLDFFKRSHSVVIDSVAGSNVLPSDIDLPEGKFILYTGGLEQEYGVKDLVNCFLGSKIRDLDLKLVLCGGGGLSEWCTSISYSNDNVVYLGKLKNEEVVFAQRKAFALINLRNPQDEFTKYSFPSKIAEYLQSGKPVITTKLKGIPNDLLPYLNIVENNVEKVLLHVLNNYEDCLKLAKDGAKYYFETRSAANQANKLDRLVNSIYS